MNDIALIKDIGSTLWGADWRAPLSAALRQPPGVLSDWESGRAAVPAEVWKDLREIVRLHQLKLADLDPRIVRAYDEAYQLAQKNRK